MCVILGSPDADCEVLRRDLAADVGRECFSELRRTGQNGSGSHTTSFIFKNIIKTRCQSLTTFRQIQELLLDDSWTKIADK